MMGDTKHETRAIFTAALALNAPAERERYLDQACEGKPGLRQRVEALLQAAGKAGEFLTQDALGGPLDCDAPPVSEGPGMKIGHYKLLEQIGEGGFGVVFMAEQVEPIHRKVALKIVKPGMDTKQVIARFEAERQALALMNHPNIAQVFDAGATDTGRPYFVMELVQGVPLTRFCDKNLLTPTERLKLFRTVCEAVQHAHQKGIIHRDLKPSNILVTLHDGKPVPKVIDFGTAKALQQPLTEKTLFTAYGRLIGTPQYMSPEQAELSGLDVDTRADIYSLGVLLYELLTGTTPFEAERLRTAAFEEMMRIIRQEEPPKPSTRISILGERATEIAKHRHLDPALLRRSLKGDLDWIVMKALEKDRTRRYETASALGEDIRHHLNHEPVKAGPPGAAYRARKFVRRHRIGVLVGASVTLALVAGLSLALLGLQRALKAEQLARWEAYASDMKAAQVSLEQNNREMALNLLRRYRPKEGEKDLRGLEWQYLWQESSADDHQNFPHPTRVHNAVLSPDGRYLVTACHDSKIRVWDVASARVIREFDTLGFKATDPITVCKALAYSRDGTRLALLGPDGVEIRETSGWAVIKKLMSSTAPVAFSADGRHLATGYAPGMQIWDQSDWSCRVLTNARCTGNAFALAPDAASLACAYYAIDEQAAWAQARVEVWDVRTGTRGVIEGTSDVFSLAISLDGRWLAYGTRLGEVGIWDMSAWSLVRKFTPHLGLVHGLAFSPDGKRLATGGIDQRIRVWETGTTNLLGTCTGHLNYIWSLEFSSNGLQLASSSMDGTAKLWSASPGSASSRAFAIPASCEVKGLIAERTRVLTIDYGARNLQIWGLPEGQSLGTIPLNRLGPEGQSVSSVCNSPGGQALVAVTTNGLVCFFHPLSGALLRSVQVAATNLEIYSVSPDQRWVLGYLRDKSGLVCDLRYPSQPLRIPDYNRANSAAGFSTDSRWLAYSTTNHHVMLWDLAANRQKAVLKGPRWWIISVALSPDGKWVASGGDDGEVWVWSSDTGKPLFDGPLKGHMGIIPIVMFSSDSRILATYGRDRTMRWWNVAAGREMLSFPSEPIYDSSVLDFPAAAGAPGRFLLFFERPGRIRVTTVPSLAEIDAIENSRNDLPPRKGG